MKKADYARGFVVGLIMLFVGTAIIPSGITTCNTKAMQTAPVELIITDDGCGDPTDGNINVPAYVPDSGITPTVVLNFTITGINTSESTAFYGDDPWEDWKNITVTGDVLYPVTELTLYHVGTQGDWTCHITPTQPGGIITLSINWPGNGTATTDIHIVNGTFVTPVVESFPWGTDVNLTIVVLDMDGAPVKTADVYLLWEDDDLQFNHTQGNNNPGNGMNGEYTFWITKEDQGSNVPQYLTISARWTDGFWGYGKVLMKQPTETFLNLTITGGIGISVVTKNAGNHDAINLTTETTITGGLFHLINIASGSLVVFPLPPEDIYQERMFPLGIGPFKVEVVAQAENAEPVMKTAEGFILFFIVILT
jgi:hypothetical protein